MALDSISQDEVDVAVYTPEPALLSMFGPSGCAALVADLDEPGVRVHTSTHVTRAEAGTWWPTPARRISG